MENEQIIKILFGVIDPIATILAVFLGHYLEKKDRNNRERVEHHRDGVYVVIIVMQVLVLFISSVTLTDIIDIRNANNEKETNIQEEIQGVEETVVATNEGTTEDTDETDGTEILDESAIVEKQISLLDLTPYTCTPEKSYGLGYPIKAEYDIVDVFGNKYATALWSYMERKDGERSMTYRLDGKYDTLEGVLAVANGAQGSSGTASIYIYADGVCVYSMEEFTSDMDSLEVSVDLTGVKDIKLEMYAGQGFSLYFCNPTLTYYE